jgi:hypothetical protein
MIFQTHDRQVYVERLREFLRGMKEDAFADQQTS